MDGTVTNLRNQLTVAKKPYRNRLTVIYYKNTPQGVTVSGPLHIDISLNESKVQVIGLQFAKANANVNTC